MSIIRFLILVLLPLAFCAQEARAVYDAGTGRWLQRDPAGYVDGMNLYEYVASRPIDAIDPMGLKLRIRGSKEFRVQSAIQQLCPGAKVNGDGSVTIPPKNENNDGGKDCDDICKNPPGCDILRDLEDHPDDIFIDRGNKPVADFQWRDNDEQRRVWIRIRYRPGYSDPIDRRKDDGSRVDDRGVSDWETLWHEMIHGHRGIKGLHPIRYGRHGKDVSRREWAREEIETIKGENALKEWYRKCEAGNQNGPPSPPNRDPFGHPLVDPVWPDIKKEYPDLER